MFIHDFNSWGGFYKSFLISSRWHRTNLWACLISRSWWLAKKTPEIHWIITKRWCIFIFSNLVVTVDPFRETTRMWSLNQNWKQWCLRLISLCSDKTVSIDDFSLSLPCWSPTWFCFLLVHKSYLILKNSFKKHLLLYSKNTMRINTATFCSTSKFDLNFTARLRVLSRSIT